MSLISLAHLSYTMKHFNMKKCKLLSLVIQFQACQDSNQQKKKQANNFIIGCLKYLSWLYLLSHYYAALKYHAVVESLENQQLCKTDSIFSCFLNPPFFTNITAPFVLNYVANKSAKNYTISCVCFLDVKKTHTTAKITFMCSVLHT